MIKIIVFTYIEYSLEKQGTDSPSPIIFSDSYIIQEMKLMIISRKNIRRVSGERIQSILSEIYTHIYNRRSNDGTLSGILGDIPESINLE